MRGGPFDGFDWDHANRLKCQKHGVTLAEIEAIFGVGTMIQPDPKHSRSEQRYVAVGRTGFRMLFVVFTLRQRKGLSVVRPISARYMHAKEIKRYEEENP
jgi:uncharacterized DUF497 family protein